MKRLEAAWGPFVLRFRALIILVGLLVVGLAASGAQWLSFTTDYRVFFSEDNPQLLAFDALEKTYAKNDNVLFVLATREGDAFSETSLAATRWLTEQAWQVPYSSRVDAISNFQHTRAEGDDLLVGDLIGEEVATDPEERLQARQIALAEPLLVGRLVAPDARVSGVNVTVQLPGVDEIREIPEVVAHVRQLADEVRTRYPDVDVYLTGMVLMNNAFAESSLGDMRLPVPLSFAAMALMLWVLSRGLSATLVTMLVVVLSILFAMGLGGWVGFPLSPPSATAPTVILTVAIANCVHVFITYRQRLAAGDPRDEALCESLRVNLQPVFLASLTTALGFLCMNFSDVPPFRHLGTLVAFGVTGSFLLAVTFLPATLSYLPARVSQRAAGGGDALMAAVAEVVIRHRRPLLWGMSAVVVVLVASVSRNELNDVFLHYFDDTVEFRRHSDFTTENLTGLYHIEYSLHSGEEGGVSRPQFLRDLAAFAKWYRAQPETLHVNVISDIFQRLNRNMHADDPAYHRLPENRELAAQYLLLYEMSLPYGLDLNNQLDIDKSATRMTVTTETMSSNEVIALDRRAQAWLAENAPAIARADGSGTTLMFANIGKRNIRSMLFGTTIALIAISMVLIVALRSVKLGFVSLVPNLIPGAMGFGIWGLAVGEVGLSLSVVTSMTLGIVVDDTVHFLSKYRRARKELGRSPADAVRYAFTTVGRALVVTSVVLMAGFAVLSLSSFELNAGMGMLTALVIGLALLADFALLPPLLMKIEGSKDDHEAAATPAATPAARPGPA